jgi:hypothetical protein
MKAWAKLKYSRSDRRQLSRKLLTAMVTGFVLLKLFPTMAEDLIPPITPIIETSQSPTPTVEPTTAPTSEAKSSISEDQSERMEAQSESSEPPASASPTPTPSKPSASLLPDQSMSLRIPISVLVDPRARSALLPAISVTGPRYVLVCFAFPSLTSNLISFNENHKVDNWDLMNFGISSGNSYLRVTGETERVMATINGIQGLRLNSLAGGLSFKGVTISAVAISMPTLDESFCRQAIPANTRSLSFRPLGLDLEIKKGDVVLKR